MLSTVRRIFRVLSFKEFKTMIMISVIYGIEKAAAASISTHFCADLNIDITAH
jgi:hypothetical protein